MASDITLTGDEESEFIQIPIKKVDFGNFVTDLLGQPEIIIFNKSGTFNVTFDWLKHIHHSLHQRITQQTNSTLVDFSAKFNYFQGGSRKVTTVEGFLNFNELKIVRTESVKIVWTYLVNFPNKNIPEKQEIELMVYNDNSDDKENDSFLSKIFTMSRVTLEIRHTERTWGDDLFTILEREIISIFEKKDSLRKLKKFTILIFAIFFITLGLLLPEYMQGIIREKEILDIYGEYSKMSGQSIKDMTLNLKIDLIIRLIDPVNKIYQLPEIYRIISMIFAFGLSFFTYFIFLKNKISFILITKKDKDDKDNYDKKEKNSLIIKIIGYLFAIFIGVAGNYVYYLLNLPTN